MQIHMFSCCILNNLYQIYSDFTVAKLNNMRKLQEKNRQLHRMYM